MQIVTLQQVKDQLNITFTTRDTALTDLTNRVENELLQYIGVADVAGLLEVLTGTESPSDEMQALVLSALESATLLAVHMRNQDPAADIWKGGILNRLLTPYRVPSISPGTA